MAEAQKGFAVLETVDEGTMERFIEWAYKGYYTPANFVRDPSIIPPPTPSGKTEWRIPGIAQPVEVSLEEIPLEELPREEAPPGLGWAEPTLLEEEAPSSWMNDQINPLKKSRKPKTKKDLKRAFLHREYKFHPAVVNIPRIHANQGFHEDYTEVFLSHARLHVFADMYDIQDLKMLTFEELHDTLSRYTLHRHRTGDIVTLLRYVYGNTLPDRSGEDLRTLLTDYVSYEMSMLMKDERFNELIIEEGGAFLADFLKVVALRIH